MKQLFHVLILGLLLVSACTKETGDALTATGKSGSITRFAVYNGYMYVLNPNEVLTYSLQDPDKPALVNRLATDYGLETIIVYDNTIYLGSNTALYILDISNPAAPAVLSKANRGFAFFGGCDPVVVKDQYAYSTIKIIQNVCGIVSSQSALLVYDVSDKSAPLEKGVYPLNIPNGLGYKDNYLFVCDEGADRLEVFDIANPLDVKPLPQFAMSISDPYDLIVDGNKMIVSTKNDFRIFSLEDLPVVKPIGFIAK